MAEIFRPSYTATDPQTGRKVKRKSPRWWIRYYTPDGVRHKVKGYRDRKATEVYAGELEKKGERGHAGMGDPFAEHVKRPLAEHLEDYRRYLEAEGNCPEYVAKTFARVRAILDGCRFVFIPDLKPEKVAEFLHGLRRDPPRPALEPGKTLFTPREMADALGGERPLKLARLLRREGLEAVGNGKARRYPRATVDALQDRVCRGIGISTSNGYLTALKGFSRWLVEKERTDRDRLISLSRLNAETDPRHERRALPERELQALLAAADRSAIDFQGLAGPDRLTLYATAMVTGFRASELASLYPGSFGLHADGPTATVKAAYSKNRRQSVQPLPRDVAEALRGYLAGRPAGCPVWPGTWHKDAAEMLRIDLEAAGIAYRDADGRVADFHALRHSYITLLSRNGVSPKTAQKLARHSDIRLTMNVYTHAELCDLAGAVASLPSILPAPSPSKASVGVLKATGTDDLDAGTPPSESGPKFLGPFLGPQPAISGDFLRQAETDGAGSDQNKNPGKIAVSCVFPGDSSKLPGEDSNLHKENQNLLCPGRNPKSTKGHTGKQSVPLAYSLARKPQKAPTLAPAGTPSTSPPAGAIDPDLTRLIAAWPSLSLTARRMILAAVEADKPAP